MNEKKNVTIYCKVNIMKTAFDIIVIIIIDIIIIIKLIKSKNFFLIPFF
jgi:hypothetical protein